MTRQRSARDERARSEAEGLPLRESEDQDREDKARFLSAAGFLFNHDPVGYVNQIERKFVALDFVANHSFADLAVALVSSDTAYGYGTAWALYFTSKPLNSDQERLAAQLEALR